MRAPMTKHVEVMDLVAQLKAAEEAFVLATVVRTVSVTAAKAGAMSAAWACPACAWPEADLVEATTDATQTSTVPSATPPGTDPVLPAAPDESRWTVESTFPLRRP